MLIRADKVRVKGKYIKRGVGVAHERLRDTAGVDSLTHSRWNGGRGDGPGLSS